ncbi:MAG: 2-amino-4-hydroxy-6-hydroxymethyldihydropteridine diphosphokinase [Proteobacteria bacterium]|nr:2-amino-4-hydroxy-6-hydroxymethyldihydropteridine diphosphokinase [Pseudomonadota bacterium]
MKPEELRPVAVSAFIGLGSNLDEPREQVRRGIAALDALEHSRLLRQSSLYASPPMGPQDQPDFINAVVELETRLPPERLLERLQAIESTQGRVRERKWGPRTLDLDLLLYGAEKISTPLLIVPHPGLPERPFVLYPLAELAPGLDIPGHGSVTALAARIPSAGTRRLAD